MTKPSPFKYFKTSEEIIRLAVMLYVRFPLSLRNVEDLLHERGVDICHETVRYWWNTRRMATRGYAFGKRADLLGLPEVNHVPSSGGDPACPGLLSRSC